MLNKVRQLNLVALAFAGLSATSLHAQEAQPGCEVATIETVATNIKTSLPATKIDQVECSGVPGFYAVTAGKNLFYTNKEGSFLFVGGFYSITDQKDITAQAMAHSGTKPGVPASEPEYENPAVRTVATNDIPESSITYGTGSKRIHLFSDPNCGFCNKAHHALKKMISDGLDVTIIEHPFGLLRGSPEAASAIHCATDAKAALDDHYLGFEASGSCAEGHAKSEQIKQVFASKGFSGTPSFIAESGETVVGWPGPQEFKSWVTEIEGGASAQALLQTNNVPIAQVSWDDLPERALLHGDEGGTKLAILTHPNCQYCRNLHKNLGGLEGYQIHEYLFSQKYESMIQGIYCNETPVAVLKDAMAGKSFTVRTTENCGIQEQRENQAFAQKYNLNNTPVFIRADGAVRNGFTSLDNLKTWLEETPVTGQTASTQILTGSEGATE